jgi:hypothetical protein
MADSAPAPDAQPNPLIERLPDGAVRITVASDRRRAMRTLFLVGGMCLVFAVLGGIGLMMPRPPVPMRLLVMAAGMGGLGTVLGFGIAAAMLQSPKQQASVFEVSPQVGLRVQTWVAGDPVRRTIGPGEPVDIRLEGSGFTIYSSRGEPLTCLPFESKEVVERVAAALRAALPAVPPAGADLAGRFKVTRPG